MAEPLGNWVIALAVSAGWLTAPGADSGVGPDPVLPMGAVCHAQFEKLPPGVFHGVGVVTEIEAATGALTLDHEDIPGLMPAMVMMYRVATPSLSGKLKVGDRVAFDLDGKSLTILSVKAIAP